MRVRISPRARADLIEIWSYIASDSETHADAFVDGLHDTVQLLKTQPGLGRRRDELASGISSFPFRRYVVFYRVIGDDLEVVRILHGSRDIESLFEGRENG